MRTSLDSAVVAEGRGSPRGVLLGSERRSRPSRADVEGAQKSGNHSEKRTGQMLLQAIDSAIVQSVGEAQVLVACGGLLRNLRGGLN